MIQIIISNNQPNKQETNKQTNVVFDIFSLFLTNDFQGFDVYKMSMDGLADLYAEPGRII